MYATQADIEARFGTNQVLLVADRDEDGNADAAVIAAALSAATGTIDSYVGQHYDLPLATVPEALKEACVVLAMHHLSGLPGAMTEELQAAKRETLAWLKDIGAGRASLGVDKPPLSHGAPTFTSKPNVWGRGKGGF